jgi:hypothetical protein
VADPVAATTSATLCRWPFRPRGLRRSQLPGGYEHEGDSRQETEENPNHWRVGVKHHGNATGTLPLERLPSRNPGRCPGSRHTPTLCAFPRACPLSGPRRFRSAHSCGAALVLHQLPCSQRPAVRQPGFLQPVNYWLTLPPSPAHCKTNFAARGWRFRRQ